MDSTLLHICLGIFLFFIINWIGKHSFSIGYMQISMFVKVEEAPAFNFFFRLLSPVVYIIIISAILYSYDLNNYVKNIYFVNIYYILFRLLFNLITNRGLLMNWYKQFIYWAGIVTLSYFTYDKLISVRKNILPDFSSISNELWIIILIFIFQVLNNIRLSNKGTVKRKKNYLKSRYTYFYKLYGKKIKEITQNEILEALCFAIIIYEDFNRPKIIRFIEKLSFYITKKPHSLGVMQVRSNKNINDYESVIAGAKKIVESYNIAIQKNQKEYFEIIDENSETIKNYNYDWKIIDCIISDYNKGTKYNYEVNDLYQIIKNRFYKKTKDRLLQ